jgi:hypothetical protein
MSGTDIPRVTGRELTFGVAVITRGLRMVVGSSTKSDGWEITADDEDVENADDGMDEWRVRAIEF